MRNGLFYSVLTNFLGNSFTGKVEHATFHLISQLAYDSTTNSTLTHQQPAGVRDESGHDRYL